VLKGDYTATDVPNGDDAPSTTGECRSTSTATTNSGSGRPRTNPEPNYFVLGEGSSMARVCARSTGDWNAERQRPLFGSNESKQWVPPRSSRIWRSSPSDTGSRAKWLLSRIHTWFNFPQWFYLKLPVNTLTEPRLTPGGLSTQ